MKMLPTVYLAGGLLSSWRTPIIDAYGHAFTFYNPQDNQSEECSRQYTTWDLFHIKKCDIVFAFMERTNKSGYGLALEIGYARALDKMIILVDERSNHDPVFANFFQIARASASVVFTQLGNGLDYLSRFEHKPQILQKYEN